MRVFQAKQAANGPQRVAEKLPFPEPAHEADPRLVLIEVCPLLQQPNAGTPLLKFVAVADTELELGAWSEIQFLLHLEVDVNVQGPFSPDFEKDPAL